MNQLIESPWIAVDLTSPEEPDIAEAILESTGKKYSDLRYVSYVDINVEAFSFLYLGQRYLLRYSLGDKTAFYNEGKFLQECRSPFGPSLARFGSIEFCGEDVGYLISSFDFAESSFENMAYFNEFSDFFWQVHGTLSNRNIKVNSIKKFLSSLEERWLFAQSFIKETSLSWLTDEVQRSFAVIQKMPIKKLTCKNNVCHGNLTPDNVLVSDFMCKIINWGSCFNCHRVFDVCYFYLGLGRNYEEIKKLSPQISDDLFELIYDFAANVYFIKHITDFCFFGFTKQKTNGLKLLSIVNKIQSAIDGDSFVGVLSDKSIGRISRLIDQTYYDENQTVFEDGDQIDDLK